jgi:hypothetical protein
MRAAPPTSSSRRTRRSPTLCIGALRYCLLLLLLLLLLAAAAAAAAAASPYDDDAGEDPNDPTSATAIAKSIAEVNTARSSVAKMMDEVQGKIDAAESQFKADREAKLAKLKAAAVDQAVEATSEYRELEDSVSRIHRRREQVNACLRMIYGGSNKFYWHIRGVLARVQPQKACSIVKNTDLPKLSLEGFTEKVFRDYGIAPPTSDGSTIRFFDTVKVPLFRCMCEQQPLPGAAGFGIREGAGLTWKIKLAQEAREERRAAATRVRNDAESVAEQGEEELAREEELRGVGKTNAKAAAKLLLLSLSSSRTATATGTRTRTATATVTTQKAVTTATTTMTTKAPANQIPIDMTKLSAADVAIMMSTVQAKIAEARKNILTLQNAISAVDSEFAEKRASKVQEFRMAQLRAQLEKSIAGKINGQMAARTSLNQCLSPISGGGGNSPMTVKIKRMLSRVPIPQRCLVFKGFHFPELYPAGHSHNKGGGVFGSKIKALVMRCLCDMAKDHIKESQEAAEIGVTSVAATEAAEPTAAEAGDMEEVAGSAGAMTSFVDMGKADPDPVVPPGASKMSPEEIESELAKIAKDKEDVVSSMKKVSATLKKEEKSFNKERAFKKEKIKLTVMKKKRCV